MKRNLWKTTKGFTLIEVMVSVSIFAIITTVGIGSLLSINTSYKKSRSQRTAVDSLTFILDSMSRDIRTGSAYTCQPGVPTLYDCYNSSGSTEFQFEDQDGRTVVYRYSNQAIERTIDGSLENLTTPDMIVINDLTFRMKSGAGLSNDTTQPFVVVSIVGESQYAGARTPIMLQTSVTQRRLDIPTN